MVAGDSGSKKKAGKETPPTPNATKLLCLIDFARPQGQCLASAWVDMTCQRNHRLGGVMGDGHRHTLCPDRGRCHKLNLMTIEFCKDNLKTGGNLAFKTFEGEDLGFVRNKAKEIFETVKDYKPKSSQKKSAEAFIVCLNKK